MIGVSIRTFSFFVVFTTMATAGERGKKPVDYQALANEARWEWSAKQASFEKCQAALSKPYAAKADLTSFYGPVTILKGDQRIHSWEGHAESVFLILGDVLYYSDHHAIASGCTVNAMDLQTGKKLWSTSLKGLGPIDHTKYRNQVNLATYDMNTLRVFARESAGGYVEFIDRRTGKTVGHRVFKDDEMAKPKGS